MYTRGFMALRLPRAVRALALHVTSGRSGSWSGVAVPPPVQGLSEGTPASGIYTRTLLRAGRRVAAPLDTRLPTRYSG